MTYEEEIQYKGTLSRLSDSYLQLVSAMHPTRWSDAQVAGKLAAMGAMVRGRGVKAFVDFPLMEDHVKNSEYLSVEERRVQDLARQYQEMGASLDDQEAPRLVSEFTQKLMEKGSE